MRQISRVVVSYMDVEESLLVIDTQRTSELSLTQKIVEGNSRPHRDARPELLPPVASIIERGDQLLVHVS